MRTPDFKLAQKKRQTLEKDIVLELRRKRRGTRWYPISWYRSHNKISPLSPSQFAAVADAAAVVVYSRMMDRQPTSTWHIVVQYLGGKGHHLNVPARKPREKKDFDRCNKLGFFPLSQQQQLYQHRIRECAADAAAASISPSFPSIICLLYTSPSPRDQA